MPRLGIGLGLNVAGPYGTGDEPGPVPPVVDFTGGLSLGTAYALGVDNGGSAFGESLAVMDAPSTFSQPIPAFDLAGLFS